MGPCLAARVARRDGIIETLKNGQYLQDAIVVDRQGQQRVLELENEIEARDITIRERGKTIEERDRTIEERDRTIEELQPMAEHRPAQWKTEGIASALPVEGAAVEGNDGGGEVGKGGEGRGEVGDTRGAVEEDLKHPGEKVSFDALEEDTDSEVEERKRQRR